MLYAPQRRCIPIKAVTLKNIQQYKKTKKVNKILAILLVVFLALSSCISASALSYNSWNLCTSQLDVSYFYSGGGSYVNSSWSVIRQRDWIASKNLSSTYNNYVISTDQDNNLIYQLEYIYDKGESQKAVDLGTRWNYLYNDIFNLLVDIEQLCGYSTNPPNINGKPVSTEAYQALYSQIEMLSDKLSELASDVKELYQLVQLDTSSAINNIGFSAIDLFDTLWNALGNVLAQVGTGSGSTNFFFGLSWTETDIANIANTVSGIVKTFAYALAVALFGINVTTTALQYELLTLRGGVKVFARVIFVKIWIDIAIPICLYILRIINSLTLQIISSFTANNVTIIRHGDLITHEINTGNGFIDGVVNAVFGIINFFSALVTTLPMIILIIVLCVCVCSVMVKLVARGFEITCLVTLSPIFFATLVGDTTSQYFKKFISAFLSTAGYIIFMAIVYVVARIWIDECTHMRVSGITDLAMSFISILPRCLIVIACCNIMRKPPKVLTSLVDGG